MNRSTLSSAFLSVAALVLLTPHNTLAQSNAAPNAAASKPDQVLQELLSEVHQLRLVLQRNSANAYRGQVMVERLRLQQEMVNRITDELNSIKSQLSDAVRSEESGRGEIDEAVKRQDKGVLSEAQVADVKARAEFCKLRAQSLRERETVVSTKLEIERANLADLNKRLDALELELMTTASQGDEPKGRVKK